MFSLAILGTKMAAWSRDHVELCAQLGERKLSGSAGSLVFSRVLAVVARRVSLCADLPSATRS